MARRTANMRRSVARSGRAIVHMVAFAVARQPHAVRLNASQRLLDSENVPTSISAPPPQSDPNQKGTPPSPLRIARMVSAIPKRMKTTPKTRASRRRHLSTASPYGLPFDAQQIRRSGQGVCRRSPPYAARVDCRRPSRWESIADQWVAVTVAVTTWDAAAMATRS